jgi:hypothetical protein
MALRILAALSLCLCFAAIPSSVSALPDLKFPLQGASYCLALDVCSASVGARGTKQWLDCVASHALRDPPNHTPGPLQKADPPAILMECGGVGWGNRFRALQARSLLRPNFGILPSSPTLTKPVPLFDLSSGFDVARSHLRAINGVRGPTPVSLPHLGVK